MAKFVLGDIRRGGVFAIAAAILFGAATPAAKVVVAGVHSLMLAGLLYLGSGLGLTILQLVRGRGEGGRLVRRDLPWLAGTVVFGGMIGPALLTYGLTAASGSAASLLLTLEGVFTAAIAWLVFREPFNLRIGLGMLAIFAGAVLLALNGPAGNAGLLGALAIAGACLSWGIDNNLTRNIAHVDAPTLATIKGLMAGTANVTLALLVGARFPGLPAIASAAVIGLLGYGVSLILFVLALREIGAARAGAYFSTAPFIGAAAAILLLHDPAPATLVVAGVLMAIGVWLHLTEPAAAEA